MNKVTQSWSYLRDKCCHKFWDPANLALEEDIKGRIVIVTGCNTGKQCPIIQYTSYAKLII